MIAGVIFVLVFIANVNTVLNNAYQFGSTLYDSTLFETIIWRSGLQLIMAPAAGATSYFDTHISPINYIPNLISYVVPLDRLTFYGVWYAFVYGSLAVIVFYIFRQFYDGKFALLLAVLSSILFQISGPMISIQWEPHQEIICPLMLILFFKSWQTQRYRLATLFLILNSTVREDTGFYLALPLFLLLLVEKFKLLPPEENFDASLQNNRFRLGLIYCGVAILLSIAAICFQYNFYSKFLSLHGFYYGSNWSEQFSYALVMKRFLYNLLHVQYLWLPCLVLAIAGVLLRDGRLIVGSIVFIPYWIFNFFSKLDINSYLAGYKLFPLIILLLWPAIFSRNTNAKLKKSYVVLQIVLLIASTLNTDGKCFNWPAPADLQALRQRWLLQPSATHSQEYKRFGNILPLIEPQLGKIYVSESVLSLYPYDFEPHYKSQVIHAQDTEFDTLIWFEGDRDADTVRQKVEQSKLPHLYVISDTKLRMLSNRSMQELDPALHDICEFKSVNTLIRAEP